MIKEKAYAKINLSLEVKNKRQDNYHEIDTIMVPVDLYDELSFKIIDEGIIIEPSFENIALKDNFIYKAAKLFLDTYKINKGVKVTIIKKIPSQAGLAGGSADASATLRGLNKLFNLNLSLDTLSNLSAKLGSDMPYCVYQKISRCTSRGEKLSLLNLKYSKIPITIVKPVYGLSTKEVYENYVYNQNNDYTLNINNIIQSLKDNDIKGLKDNIFNDLTKSSLKINYEFNQLFNTLNEYNKFFMSGSGPSMFCFGHHDIKIDNLQIIKTFII